MALIKSCLASAAAGSLVGVSTYYGCETQGTTRDFGVPVMGVNSAKFTNENGVAASSITIKDASNNTVATIAGFANQTIDVSSYDWLHFSSNNSYGQTLKVEYLS